MNYINDVIKQRVKDKEQKRRAQSGMLFIFLISSFMVFLTLYIYYSRQIDPTFKLNTCFEYSSILIVFSSLCIHVSYLFYKNDDLPKGFVTLILSLLITIGFCVLQVLGWNELKATYHQNSVLFNNYKQFMILSVFHLLHITGGLIYLSVLTKQHLSYQIHSRNINLIRFAAYYWHFLGIIWLIVYLLFK
jgi:cytochrome c oxidase subunit 3